MMFEIKYRVSKRYTPSRFQTDLAAGLDQIAKDEAKRQSKSILAGKNTDDQPASVKYKPRYAKQKIKAGKAGRPFELTGELKNAAKSLKIARTISKSQIKFAIRVKSAKIAKRIDAIHRFQWAKTWPENRHFWGFGFTDAGRKRKKAITERIGEIVEKTLKSGTSTREYG